jgi:hypothetical protein
MLFFFEIIKINHSLYSFSLLFSFGNIDFFLNEIIPCSSDSGMSNNSLFIDE